VTTALIFLYVFPQLLRVDRRTPRASVASSSKTEPDFRFYLLYDKVWVVALTMTLKISSQRSYFSLRSRQTRRVAESERIIAASTRKAHVNQPEDASEREPDRTANLVARAEGRVRLNHAPSSHLQRMPTEEERLASVLRPTI
jgi:hypothetical protein